MEKADLEDVKTTSGGRMSLISSYKKRGRKALRPPRSTSPTDFLEADYEAISSQHLLRMHRQEILQLQRSEEKSNSSSSSSQAQQFIGDKSHLPEGGPESPTKRRRILEPMAPQRRQRSGTNPEPTNANQMSSQGLNKMNPSSGNITSAADNMITSDHIDNMFRAVSSMYYQPRVNTSDENPIMYNTLELLLTKLVSRSVFDHWTPREIALFEAGLTSKGKDFFSISSLIQTKTTNECVEFYYQWKKSSHYHLWDSLGKARSKLHGSTREEQWQAVRAKMGVPDPYDGVLQHRQHQSRQQEAARQALRTTIPHPALASYQASYGLTVYDEETLASIQAVKDEKEAKKLANERRLLKSPSKGVSSTRSRNRSSANASNSNQLAKGPRPNDQRIGAAATRGLCFSLVLQLLYCLVFFSLNHTLPCLPHTYITYISISIYTYSSSPFSYHLIMHFSFFS